MNFTSPLNQLQTLKFVKFQERHFDKFNEDVVNDWINFTSHGREVRVVYYESIKRELKIRCIYECRCDERKIENPGHPYDFVSEVALTLLWMDTYITLMT